jgi:hypothetical protein
MIASNSEVSGAHAFNMNTLLYDLRNGSRMLLKNPGFTFAALITLALGIASSTAIFSVIDGVLLHPLPYPDSEKIMVLLPTMRSTAAPRGAVAPRPGSTKVDSTDIRIATPEYFRTMGIPLVRSRNFNEHDAKGSTLVTIINEQTARDVFPGEDPIGQFIENYGPKNEKLQVVGVVGNVRHLALETAPRPEIYQLLGQGMWPLVNIAVRTAPENPLTLLPAVQQAVWSVNKSVPLAHPRSMNEMIARTLLQKKFTMLLLSIFAGAALLVAAIGLYGVISYSVVQRTRELGILVAFIACWLPARRASAVDPIVALHAE